MEPRVQAAMRVALEVEFVDVEPLTGGRGDADMDTVSVAHGGVTVPEDAGAVVVGDVTVPLGDCVKVM